MDASNGSYVTVGDVVDAVYHILRRNVTAEEFNALPSIKNRQRVTRAYEARYRRLRSSRTYEEEKRQGMKRVDFLMGSTRFTGLSPPEHGRDEWTLAFS